MKTINLAIATDPDKRQTRLLIATDSLGLNGLILDELQAKLNEHFPYNQWDVFPDSDNQGMIGVLKRHHLTMVLEEFTTHESRWVEDWAHRLKGRVQRLFEEET